MFFRFKSDFKNHRKTGEYKKEKDLREIVSLFCFVGVDGFEPPTLCL